MLGDENMSLAGFARWFELAQFTPLAANTTTDARITNRCMTCPLQTHHGHL
jgi:hypothetical protein